MDLENVAYTKEYEEMRAPELALVAPEYVAEESEEELSFGYALVEKRYRGVVDGYNCGVATAELRDENGALVYGYTDVDSTGCADVFRHSDGDLYFLFHRDLYGYSVLNLRTMADFHYYPKESLPTGETFIWCGAHYNPANDMLAVEGCYWACPSEILLVDFSRPMEEPKRQAELWGWQKDKTGELVLVGWQGKDLRVYLETWENGQKARTEYVIAETEYLGWME